MSILPQTLKIYGFQKRVCSNENTSCQVCPQFNEVFLVFAKVFQLQCFLRQFLSNFYRFFSSSSNFFVVFFAYEAEDTFSFRGSDAWAHNLRG